jgi:hypothetical protein
MSELMRFSVITYTLVAIFIIGVLSVSIIASLTKDKTFYQRCKDSGGIPMPSSYSDGICLSVNAVIRLEGK